jgi:uncharacterized UPF0160 family protein
METVVTHSGSFDPDDVLAVATLQLHLGVENLKVIRSRNAEVIEKADWVVDVGGKYDAATRRFDHHQNGVPKRENGVPYSAFGLLWKEFGVVITDSQEAADYIEKKLVQPIDAADNHVTVCHPTQADVAAFELYDVIDALKQVWGSEESFDSQFPVAVDLARGLLLRLIAHGKSQQAMEAMIREQYEADKQKAVLEFSEPVPRHALVTYEEVQVVVSPVTAEDVDHWMAAVVPVHPRSFQNRAIFPEAWAGLVHEELIAVSGIEGAVFCHKERYIFVAETKAAAMKAAHHARM